MEHDYDILTRFFQSLRSNELPDVSPFQNISEGKNFDYCTYPQGYIEQSIYVCKTCKSTQGICTGCLINCHSDHEFIEIGPKKDFRCDCGLGKVPCKLYPLKAPNANVYSHNFLGKFCICDVEDSERARESDMHMCVSCYDWFHISCIQIYNDCHNLAARKFHQSNIPVVPEDASDYFFICEACVQGHLYIPMLYKKYICLENTEDVGETMIERYPYHMFIKKKWIEERSQFSNIRQLEVTGVQFFPIKKSIRKTEDFGRIDEMVLEGTHEQQINMARGLCTLREILLQALQEDLRTNLQLELKEFKRKVLELQNQDL